MPTDLDDPFELRDKCTTKARANIPVLQSKYIHYFTPRFADLCTGTILLEEEKLKSERKPNKSQAILVYEDL